MFTYIYEWLKNLSGYLLIVTMITGILPDTSYRKYIRFFCGMIMIVMLAMPLLQIFHIEEDFKEIYHSIEYKNVVRELEEAGKIAVEESDVSEE